MNCYVETPIDNLLESGSGVVGPPVVRSKIPRPPNAFMLFANDHRKALAYVYPADSNKEISRRLGQTWKNLSLPEKNQYYQKAKEIDLEHKRRYPGYVYNPKDARLRKAVRTTLKNRAAGPSRQRSLQEEFWGGCSHGFEPSVVVGKRQQLSETASSNVCVLSLDVFGQSEDDRKLFEKEKYTLVAAESYNEVGKLEERVKSSYLPISSTKFNQDPELFTNNAEYHKEYIVKYFNHIPDYETYNVTIEDGISFPYVTIPHLLVKQNL
ncbi:sex-determining region Y protein-like [Euwallacea fornicatus]|uniref:sex-determining region Y protein-like n=1 Tax=Euwallacea fornicatus TaxID=995702 RepID=UPI00338D4479